MPQSPAAISSARRCLMVLHALGAADATGLRLKDVAAMAGCSQPAAHRALQDLLVEGLAEQVDGAKRYRLALGLFVLAARGADQADGLRTLARPALLRLSSTLNDTVFLLARKAYDAVCLDRVEGPFPIRSFTGDIGGSVPLGIGQGSLAILAHLPDSEREAVIRFNIPRILDRGFLDEPGLRREIDHARASGFVAINTGLIPQMAGVAVPIHTPDGRTVAALSVGTLAERLKDDRLPFVVAMLKAEAEAIGARANPFDPTFRQPMRALLKE